MFHKSTNFIRRLNRKNFVFKSEFSNLVYGSDEKIQTFSSIIISVTMPVMPKIRGTGVGNSTIIETPVLEFQNLNIGGFDKRLLNYTFCLINYTFLFWSRQPKNVC